ncbi:MAG: SNF2-related protein [Treponema sp.]|nr:SNF2-related protein [Treponema sp.]
MNKQVDFVLDVRGMGSKNIVIDEHTIFPDLIKSFGESSDDWDGIEKALNHKYIRRVPKKSGKGYWYIYAETFKKPLQALKQIFGLQSKVIDDTYSKNNIQKDYGADKKTFMAHVLEYLSNKLKWDNFFGNKENSEIHKTPRKSPPTDSGKGKKPVDKTAKKNDNKITVNRSLMRKIWGIYNGQEANNEGTTGDRIGVTGRQVSQHTTTVQPGQNQGNGGKNGSETVQGTPDNSGDDVQLPSELGERSGRSIRLTKKETLKIREKCLELLKNKSDNEMTEADKELLRQYEGSGGLGEENATTHGTLYEYYTPRNVISKVWQLVDKYMPGAKSVLEPSAGTGRFAENRPMDRFTLNEFDVISSRIAGILNPEAENKQGAFQAMFKPGKPYAGRKYDVVIGNPPYGDYEGVWKGKGEGEDHKKYDEYFIDRGLDTLREGGIMAFVVPSGFLRSGNDKIKKKIAAKGKLLEAWRLPNGTFNTTGVGTDIIIIRKEKGDPAELSDNAYFQNNPDMIVGTESTRTGRFGTEKYVALEHGVTFDEAIDGINAGKIEATPTGIKPEEQSVLDNTTFSVEKPKSGKSRSEAMKGNQNARKDFIDDLKNTLEGVKITATDKDGNIHTISRTGENLYHVNKTGTTESTDYYIALQGNGLWVCKIGGEKRGEYNSKEKAQEAMLNAIVNKYRLPETETSTAEKPTGKTRSEAMMGNDNAAGQRTVNVDTAAQFNAKYNKKIDPKDLQIWKTIGWDFSINTKQLTPDQVKYMEKSDNYVKAVDGLWYHAVNFASGDIYNKLDQLEIAKDSLSKKEYERQKALLLSALPKPLSVMDIEINPLQDIADKFMVKVPEKSKWGDDTGEEVEVSLNKAFRDWLWNTPQDQLALNTNKRDILDYIDKKSVRAESKRGASEDDKKAAAMEADRTRTKRREDGDRLFMQYVREQLKVEDQTRLEDTYNRQSRGFVLPDIDKIPLFLDGITTQFKGQEFIANESQIRGASRLVNQGNGILALDVGVGKTICGIMAAMSAMQMGSCKKPIITVPKAVIDNWEFEIKELFPNIKINKIGNFSDIAKWKDKNGKLNIEDGSISLCTYEGLKQIGFEEGTINNELKEIFKEALKVMEDEGGNSKGKKGKRNEAKEEESIMTMVGKASRTGDNSINWEDTGFDYIVADEAHNFRNSFKKPRTKKSGDADEFKDIPCGGKPAIGALKLFAIAQMIQEKNNGRNVCLLTATPFQNSPVEIYNMLSLVARKELEKMGIINFNEFLAQFAELKPELAPDYKNDIKQKNVMKGFKNLQALQGLLNRYIMKVDGEDAGIIRPDKEDRHIYLNMTPEQRDITEKIRAYMEAGPDMKEDPGATLRCIMKLKQAALSPVLVDGFEFKDKLAAKKAGIKERIITVKGNDFVTDSPKMKFTADAVAKFNKAHPDIGQIVYVPQGINNYESMRNYLISQGVPADAITFMAPPPDGAKNRSLFLTGDTDASNELKEVRKARFNDSKDICKIIIAGDTILEGVNLNGNTAQTIVTDLPWNNTDLDQLAGRSHRQGNAQGMVNITIPLMNDSVDSFMYQKHDEKKSRLDTLWNSKSNKMEISAISAEELKFLLIKDPKKRADMIIKEKTAEMEQSKKISEANSNKIISALTERKEHTDDMRRSQKEIDARRKEIEKFTKMTDEEIIKEHEIDFNERWSRTIYTEYGNVSGSNIKELRDNYLKAVKDRIADEQKTINRCKGKVETINNSLKRYGVQNPEDEGEAEAVSKKLSQEALRYKERIETIKNSKEDFIKEAERQIKADSRQGMAVSAAVNEIDKIVNESLIPMKDVRARKEAEMKAMGKSQIIFLLDRQFTIKREAV